MCKNMDSIMYLNFQIVPFRQGTGQSAIFCFSELLIS
jgi:hypothetical protein